MRRNLVFALIYFVLIFSCSNKKLSDSKIEDAIKYSGFIPYKDSMLLAAKPELDIYNFKSGETIADIGFGTGWLEGITLLKYDSLTFYANEIDNYSLHRLDLRINKYLELRGKDNTNKLVKVKGTKRRTNLPETTFDKVVLRETLHHFSYQTEMLHDIWKILKPKGKLYIHEPLVDSTYYSKSCRSTIYSREDLLFIFEANAPYHFKLVKEHDLIDFGGNVPPWWTKGNFEKVPKKIYVFTKEKVI